ncbi:MAG: AgmX/PglI C-terminal domain-containing protein [bacterium]
MAAGGGSDPMLPEKLSRQQILMVVKQNAGGIRACKSEDPSASGTVMVSMVIDSSGSVSSASVPSGPFKGTSVGGCVEQKVKGFRFPQFRGEPMRINMPLRPQQAAERSSRFIAVRVERRVPGHGACRLKSPI